MDAGREEDRRRAEQSRCCPHEALSGALDGCCDDEHGLEMVIDRARAAEPPPDPAPTYRAADLLAGSPTAQIVLEDRVYTLRLTRAGKLILTR